VPNTHYLFTAGKDKMVKYWDIDRWELLLELPGHHAEVCSVPGRGPCCSPVCSLLTELVEICFVLLRHKAPDCL